MRSPVAVVVMDGTLMVTESAVTLSITPVVIPHSESHPCFGGNVLQSQVDVPVLAGWVGFPVGPLVDSSGVVGVDWHAIRNTRAQMDPSGRRDIREVSIRIFPQTD